LIRPLRLASSNAIARRSGSISVAVQIHKHLIARNTEPICDCFNDAEIRLMWNNAGNVLDGESSLIEDFLAAFSIAVTACCKLPCPSCESLPNAYRHFLV